MTTSNEAIARPLSVGIVDISGQKFGRLTVVSFHSVKGGSSKWNCVCDCGKTRVVRKGHLKSGDTKSCGCLVKEWVAENKTKHGMCGTPEYVSWQCMKYRCYYPKHKDYHSYGGRGITVCPQWLHSFETFLNDMGTKPTPDYTIDRINVNGNYEPSNCKWSTMKEQNMNTRKQLQSA